MELTVPQVRHATRYWLVSRTGTGRTRAIPFVGTSGAPGLVLPCVCRTYFHTYSLCASYIQQVPRNSREMPRASKHPTRSKDGINRPARRGNTPPGNSCPHRRRTANLTIRSTAGTSQATTERSISPCRSIRCLGLYEANRQRCFDGPHVQVFFQTVLLNLPRCTPQAGTGGSLPILVDTSVAVRSAPGAFPPCAASGSFDLTSPAVGD